MTTHIYKIDRTQNGGEPNQWQQKGQKNIILHYFPEIFVVNEMGRAQINTISVKVCVCVNVQIVVLNSFLRAAIFSPLSLWSDKTEWNIWYVYIFIYIYIYNLINQNSNISSWTDNFLCFFLYSDLLMHTFRGWWYEEIRNKESENEIGKKERREERIYTLLYSN